MTLRKVQIARGLRATSTLAERRAWTLLRNRRMLGFKFRRQHVVDGFVVDFYCAEHRLVVELDGPIHRVPRTVEYDAARTARLEARGLRVVRLKNEDVRRTTIECLLRNLIVYPPSPRRGEGDRG